MRSQEIHAASDVSGNLNHPLALLLYIFSCIHYMTVSPPATASTISPAADDLALVTGREKTFELLRKAGFTHIEIKQLPHDVVNDYYIVCK